MAILWRPPDVNTEAEPVPEPPSITFGTFAVYLPSYKPDDTRKVSIAGEMAINYRITPAKLGRKVVVSSEGPYVTMRVSKSVTFEQAFIT
jgi:hypothetical protein